MGRAGPPRGGRPGPAGRLSIRLVSPDPPTQGRPSDSLSEEWTGRITKLEVLYSERWLRVCTNRVIYRNARTED